MNDEKDKSRFCALPLERRVGRQLSTEIKMTKSELLKFLEPFTDDIEIRIGIDGDELHFYPEYQHDYVLNPDAAAQILLRAE